MSPSEEPAMLINNQHQMYMQSMMDMVVPQLRMFSFKMRYSHIPVIIPLSEGEYSTQSIGPAWHANTASHVPRLRDHTLAVQSSLPVIMVSPVILIDLQQGFILESIGKDSEQVNY